MSKENKEKSEEDFEESELEEIIDEDSDDEEETPKIIYSDKNKFLESFNFSESSSPSLNQSAIFQQSRITNLENEAQQQPAPTNNSEEDESSYISKISKEEEKKYLSYELNNSKFKRPEEIVSQRQDSFSGREVGFNVDSRMNLNSSSAESYMPVSNANFEKDFSKKDNNPFLKKDVEYKIMK